MNMDMIGTELLTKEQIAEIEDLKARMKKSLKDTRFQHTVGVAYTASALAMAHGCSIYKALVAGILHDCAKCYSDAELLDRCRKKGLEIRPIEERNPSLLHAKYGAFLAKSKYGVMDEEILSAILWHTTGRPEMSLLEKIVFTADYIEPYRNHSESLPEVRRMAFNDLDGAMVQILKAVLSYLDEKKAALDDMTLKTYDYLVRNR